MEKVVLTFGWEEKGTRSRPDRRPSRSRCIPKATRPACASCTRACPADAVDDHGKGWANYLERLSVRVTGGDPGPDRP